MENLRQKETEDQTQRLRFLCSSWTMSCLSQQRVEQPMSLANIVRSIQYIFSLGPPPEFGSGDFWHPDVSRDT